MIQELSKSEVNPKRWASWFLQVADDEGQFLHLPIGRPALEIVTPDSQPFHAREVEASRNRQAVESETRRREVAMLMTQLSQRRQRAAELFEHWRSLRQALSALSSANVSGLPRNWPWKMPEQQHSEHDSKDDEPL